MFLPEDAMKLKEYADLVRNRNTPAVLMQLAALVEQSFYGRKKPSADAAFCRAVRSCSFSAAGTSKQDR